MDKGITETLVAPMYSVTSVVLFTANATSTWLNTLAHGPMGPIYSVSLCLKCYYSWSFYDLFSWAIYSSFLLSGLKFSKFPLTEGETNS